MQAAALAAVAAGRRGVHVVLPSSLHVFEAVGLEERDGVTWLRVRHLNGEEPRHPLVCADEAVALERSYEAVES